MGEIIRPATVAGSFYPDNPEILKKTIEDYLIQTSGVSTDSEVFGLVVPHAGYVYSGYVAGKAYSLLKKGVYDTAIIIGPSHHEQFQGASIFSGDGYQSPIATSYIDKEYAMEIVENSPIVHYSELGHNWKKYNEHSIEVQIPFIQIVLNDIPIIPIAVGSQNQQASDKIALAIYRATKKLGKRPILIASSDLSHFHNKVKARELDLNIVETFADYDYFKLAYNLFNRKWEACGACPLLTVMQASELFGANKAESLFYATSADSPYVRSGPDRVVGYFSACLIKEPAKSSELPDFSDEEKELILNIAKETVKATANNKRIPWNETEFPANLRQRFAVFVTIKKHQQLRACMGHTFSNSELWEEIVSSARLAATSDSRFGHIRKNEIDELEFEVTALSRMKRIIDFSEIEIGKHGLYIKKNNSAGLLLPQVASERNWDVETFLKNICHKAGLNENDYLSEQAQIFIFEAKVIE